MFTAYTNMVETALEQFLSSRIPVSVIVSLKLLRYHSLNVVCLYFRDSGVYDEKVRANSGGEER